jgi:hypothetical protein
VLSNPAVLGTADASGGWAWAGARLSADGRIGATQRFPDLPWDERRRRVGAEEGAWLAAQWEPPSPGDRFEVRFATGRGANRIRAALLLRARAADAAGARELALGRLLRAADPDGALPPHVGAAAIEDEAELRTWLEYPGQLGALVELRKHLSVGRIARGGTRLRAAVCHGFFAEGAAWDAWWRRFAALRQRAVLCVGFDCYDAGNPQLQERLQQRTLELEDLAVDRTPSPLNPNPVPAEPAARLAAPGYRRALATYRGRCFQVRVALASEQPVPPILVESLARTISSVEGAVVPVPVAPAEYELALREHRGLGAPWLPLTYQQHLHPVRLDPMDQILHSLADVAEAGAVLSLPVHWQGMPNVFDAIGSELRDGD